MKRASLGAVAVVVAALLWSLDGFLRVQLYSLPPTIVVFWEHVFGLIVLLPFVLPQWRKFLTLTKAQWWSIGLVALLSGALGTILYTAALGQVQYINYSVVVLLQKMQPLFAIAAAAVLLREKITKKFVGLAVLAMVAAYFVSFPQLSVSLTTGSGTMVAALMAVGAAACWGISTAFSKFSLNGVPFLHVTAARFALTPIFAYLFAAALHQNSQITALTRVQWQYIGWITISTGLVALAIYYYGLQRIPASRSTLLELTWPLSAVVVGYLFLGDHLTLTQWLGAAVLLVTIVAISREATTTAESPEPLKLPA